MTAVRTTILLLALLVASASAQDEGFRLVDTDAALLVIDVQEFYFPGGSTPLVGPEPAATAAAGLIEAFRRAGRPVVHVGHRVGEGEAFHAEVVPSEGEPVVMKDEVCAFVGTGLHETLQALDVDHLVIVGMQTHMCVEGAVRAGRDLGYDCTVVADACATRDLTHDGTTVPAAQVHAATLAALDGAYARVVDAETFLAEAVSPFDPIRYRREELAENLFDLRGAGGNMLVCVGPEGLLLIDTDYQEMGDRLADELAEFGAPPRLVINTHWHFDHVGGNEALAAAGAEIAAHPKTLEFMSSDHYLDVLHADNPPWPEAARPTRLFGEPSTLTWGDERIELTPVAGHTGGDLIVRFTDADVVHVGDQVFSGGYPYIDTRQGGSVDAVIASLTAVIEASGPETRVIPGHGAPLDVEGLRAYVAMLQEYRDVVAGEMEKGLDLAALQETRPAAHLDADWGDRMMPTDLFIEEVWISLGGEPSAPPAAEE